jgi:hypothetical protein
MTSLPKATSAAEYLKSYIHDILGAFQTGAGVHDGAPLPMTFELAVKSIWYEIDRVFYQEWPKDAERRVTLRVQGKGSLLDLLKILTAYGIWTVRSSTREVGGEEGTTVAHVTGVLHPARKASPVALLVTLLEVLAAGHWSVTNTTFGAA